MGGDVRKIVNGKFDHNEILLEIIKVLKEENSHIFNINNIWPKVKENGFPLGYYDFYDTLNSLTFLVDDWNTSEFYFMKITEEYFWLINDKTKKELISHRDDFFDKKWTDSYKCIMENVSSYYGIDSDSYIRDQIKMHDYAVKTIIESHEKYIGNIEFTRFIKGIDKGYFNNHSVIELITYTSQDLENILSPVEFARLKKNQRKINSRIVIEYPWLIDISNKDSSFFLSCFKYIVNGDNNIKNKFVEKYIAHASDQLSKIYDEKSEIFEKHYSYNEIINFSKVSKIVNNLIDKKYELINNEVYYEFKIDEGSMTEDDIIKVFGSGKTLENTVILPDVVEDIAISKDIAEFIVYTRKKYGKFPLVGINELLSDYNSLYNKEATERSLLVKMEYNVLLSFTNDITDNKKVLLDFIPKSKRKEIFEYIEKSIDRTFRRINPKFISFKKIVEDYIFEDYISETLPFSAKFSKEINNIYDNFNEIMYCYWRENKKNSKYISLRYPIIFTKELNDRYNIKETPELALIFLNDYLGDEKTFYINDIANRKYFTTDIGIEPHWWYQSINKLVKLGKISEPKIINKKARYTIK